MQDLPTSILQKVAEEYLPIEDINSLQSVHASVKTELGDSLIVLRDRNMMLHGTAQSLLLRLWLKGLDASGLDYRRGVCMDHYDDGVRLYFTFTNTDAAFQRIVDHGKTSRWYDLPREDLWQHFRKYTKAGYQMLPNGVNCNPLYPVTAGDTPLQRRRTRDQRHIFSRQHDNLSTARNRLSDLRRRVMAMPRSPMRTKAKVIVNAIRPLTQKYCSVSDALKVVADIFRFQGMLRNWDPLEQCRDVRTLAGSLACDILQTSGGLSGLEVGQCNELLGYDTSDTETSDSSDSSDTD